MILGAGTDASAGNRIDPRPILIVTGLVQEARIAAGPGMAVICSSSDPRQLRALLSVFDPSTIRGVISFGVAGGLAPHLRSGACVVGSAVLSGSNRIPTSHEWSRKLLDTIPGSVSGMLLGVSRPVAHPDDKRELYLQTGAIAVDMESHIVAAVGAAHELPVAAIRVITDPAKRALPVSAVAAMRPNGTTDIGAMLRSVLKRPRELPALLLTAFDARAARATLVRGRHLLEPALTQSVAN